MKKIFLLSLFVLTGATAFGADQISVQINGQSYICSGNGATNQPTVVKTYCECRDSFGVSLLRNAVMSDGSVKTISSTSLTPQNGSYSPSEYMKKCQDMLKQCR